MEKEMITSRDPFKSCRVPLNGVYKIKTIDLVSCTDLRNFHTSKDYKRNSSQNCTG